MAIWMDMTYSLEEWQGGIIGIVRFELETAQKMKRLQPGLRFCLFRKNTVEEIPDHELEWLFKADNVADAYLEKMRRAKRGTTSSAPAEKTTTNKIVTGIAKPVNLYPALRDAYGYSLSRKERLKQAMRLLVSGLHPAIRKILSFLVYLIFWPVLLLMHLRIMIKKHYIQAKTLSRGSEGVRQNEIPAMITHPFAPGDVLYSCGWIDQAKFNMFSVIKNEMPDLKLSHFIYDLVLYKVRRVYPSIFTNQFLAHFSWVSEYCDHIIYGGQTAQNDGIEYQESNGLNSPPSTPVKIGTERFCGALFENPSGMLKKLGICDNYILTVGTVEPRKNYDTLYKAYIFLSEMLPANRIPQLVIVGSSAYHSTGADLVGMIKRDSRTCDKILLISPSDDELDLLYQKCQFFILPSLYEGWSLTLPEALAYGKFCVVSDVPPLKEVGADLVDYVDALNSLEWARKIAFYTENPDVLKRKAEKIKKNWKVISWEDCARQVLNPLNMLEKSDISGKLPHIYYNFSTLWVHMLANGSLDGIMRATILLAKHLRHVFPYMRFYYLDHEGYHSIPGMILQTLFNGSGTIESSYEAAKALAIRANQNAGQFKTQPDTGGARTIRPEIKKSFWLFSSVLPESLQGRLIRLGIKTKGSPKDKEAEDIRIFADKEDIQTEMKVHLPFERDSVILSPAFDQPSCYKFLIKKKKEIGFHFCQILYDFSPILMPQLHGEEMKVNYPPFLDYAYKMSDIIFYGGKTAMNDGIKYQRAQGLPEREGIPVKFGDHIAMDKNEKVKKADDERELKSMGITGAYILTVGTIQPRKNHETLYKAYLKMLERDIEPPQLIIAGHVGWKTGDFLGILDRDERVARKILHFSPSDSQLDILYRNCLFTVLSSQYEGWSLTLPESYGYGKFCLVSDVAPLRETGGDLAEYIHPFDTEKWAERIAFYAENPDEVAKWENRIKSNWQSTTWKECAGHIAEELIRRFERKI